MSFDKELPDNHTQRYEELLDALFSGDESIITQKLEELQKTNESRANYSPVDRFIFERCMLTSIKLNHIEAVKILLSQHYAKEETAAGVYRSWFRRPSEPISREIASLLMNFACDNNVCEKNSRSLEQFILEYSHRLGLNGSIHEPTTNLSIRLEGMPPLDSVLALRNVFKLYMPKDSSIYEAIDFTYNSSQFNGISYKPESLLFERYQAGKMILLGSGWMGRMAHMIGFGVQYDVNTNRTYISISNRGLGGLEICSNLTGREMIKNNSAKYGTIVYELVGKLDEGFFKTNSSLPWDDSKENFYEKINKHLENAKPIAILPAEGQKYGTCTYVNPKRAIEGLLYISSLINHSPNDEETRARIHQEYKAFSVFDKNNVYEELIEYHHEFCNSKDATAAEIELLNKFLAKIIMTHHSHKYDEMELENGRKLYSILPTEMQSKISHILPALTKNRNELQNKLRQQAPFYSSIEKQNREIRLVGDLDDILNCKMDIGALLEYLKLKGFSGKEIPQIFVEKENVIKIFTVHDQSVKTNLSVDIFANELGATIQNIEGYRYSVFSVTDLGDIKTALQNIRNIPNAGNIPTP